MGDFDNLQLNSFYYLVKDIIFKTTKKKEIFFKILNIIKPLIIILKLNYQNC